MDGHDDYALPDQILNPVGPLRQQFERPALASDLVRSYHVKILGAMRHERDVVVAAKDVLPVNFGAAEIAREGTTIDGNRQPIIWVRRKRRSSAGGQSDRPLRGTPAEMAPSRSDLLDIPERNEMLIAVIKKISSC